jgi:glycogen debranching enzyme
MSDALRTAEAVLRNSILRYRGVAVGTVAACDPGGLSAVNYEECFVRDFAVSAGVFLLRGESEIVRDFLKTVVDIQHQRRAMSGHKLASGMMPASFRIDHEDDGTEALKADFGDKAIGRVAPVDSMFWWTILLGQYVRSTRDLALAERDDFQEAIRDILNVCLREEFEDFPTLMVPDGSFMIDRRMGVNGHPLEIQVLLYATLDVAQDLLRPCPENEKLISLVQTRKQALLSYLRIMYWMDLKVLNEVHRFKTEEFGQSSHNALNIYPESIPDWLMDWMPDDAGYFVGNLGPSRIDTRFFCRGNLMAISFGIAYDDQAAALMRLFDARWEDLVGDMPCKICYPALSGVEWQLTTGSDPKNVPWSYHNGGNWPVLLAGFVMAAIKTGRVDLALRACEIADRRLADDDWPEYYDGKRGRLIGRRANLFQIWSAVSYLTAHEVLNDHSLVDVYTPEYWRPAKRESGCS